MNIVMPGRKGFMVEWETDVIDKRTGKVEKKVFMDDDKAKVEAKRNDLLSKGFVVSEINPCAY